jgi:hypothetical protein
MVQSFLYCNLLLTPPSGKPCRCGDYTWQLSSWAACDAACGEGTATRNITCLHKGVEVEVESEEYVNECVGQGLPPSTRACFARPCAGVMWSVGPWSGCQAGRASRSVTCVTLTGQIADAGVSMHPEHRYYGAFHFYEQTRQAVSALKVLHSLAMNTVFTKM